jgi:outer membrane biosynthesis protein TonB
MRTHRLLTAVLAFCAAAAVAQDTTSTHAESQSLSLPRRIRVSGGVIVGLVEHRTLPEYPEAAIKAGLQGNVIFKIVIDDTGKIVLSEPVEGQPLLIAASLDALRDFHFRPYLLNGTPIQVVESHIGFHFDLKGKRDKARGEVEYMSTIPYRPEFRTGVENATGTFTLWPHKVSGPDPQLPPELGGKAGSVYLTVVIGTDGKVQDVKVISGDSQFVDPVVDAVKQFVYEPQLVGGKPAVATIEASYHFGPRQ